MIFGIGLMLALLSRFSYSAFDKLSDNLVYKGCTVVGVIGIIMMIISTTIVIFRYMP